MEPIEFRDMAYVMAVYEERSFSRAAERCYISQPALSKMVKRVEKNIGFEIFDRGSSPLKVTSEGEGVIEYFLKMQEVRTELERFCDTVMGQRKCDLSIGAPSYFCTHVLPPLISAFQLENPGYHIKLMETNDNDLRKFLKTGIVDIGLSVEPNMPPELSTFVLKNETIILAVPVEYAINRELKEYMLSYDEVCSGQFRDEAIEGISLARLREERFLFLKQGNDMYRRGMKICRDAGFQPNIVMELDQLLSAYYLAAAGEGVAFIRASIPFYTKEFRNQLVYYKIDHPETLRQIRVFYNDSIRINAKLDKFIQFMKNYPLPG